MEGIKPTLGFGYPIKSYVFTGKFQGILQGFYKATRNKKMVWAPIYVDYEGKILLDMNQVREEG